MAVRERTIWGLCVKQSQGLVQLQHTVRGPPLLLCLQRHPHFLEYWRYPLWHWSFLKLLLLFWLRQTSETFLDGTTTLSGLHQGMLTAFSCWSWRISFLDMCKDASTLQTISNLADFNLAVSLGFAWVRQIDCGAPYCLQTMP